MSDHAHPYRQLPSKAYWKSAVADRAPEQPFEGLWAPRFPISATTRFSTSGSCFAQRISRWLRANGYSWVDTEPAPPGLTPEQVEAGGWGVFSFRTANIYTVAQLEQWISWALGDAVPPDEVWENDGRFFDPFRPTIPEQGYATAQEVLEARRHTLDCIRSALPQIDVFVFTLGLTEGWEHADGYAYPMCPGTVQGRFDPLRHRFVNYSSNEIARRLSATMDRLRQVRADMRFLLTVSPVPLTATASGEHVLTATTYSKSVLRAVAGELVAQRDDTDYFPSYELIAGFQSGGRYYESNLRSVRTTGVEFVMRHFAAGLGLQVTPAATRSNAAAPGAAVAAAAVDATDPDDAGEVSCEEAKLEAFALAPSTGTQNMVDHVHLCLLGDSHMTFLARALRRRGVPHIGNMIMRGSAWYKNLFHLDKDDLFVPLEDARSRRIWSGMLPFFQPGHPVAATERVVISNIGLHTHMAARPFAEWVEGTFTDGNVDTEKALAYYRRLNRERLRIVGEVKARGFRVIVLTDPPMQSRNAQMRPFLASIEAYEALACHVLNSLGCETYSVRELMNVNGFDGSEARFYRPEPDGRGGVDWIHGSEAWYDGVVAALLPAIGWTLPDALAA
ncbi:GSCFA domain-containing protein [Ideonella sp. DXS29W]|uniref:GSCFA domain-containing protein n=1 Tax=Ideonella lacteola TaxID=2984193 RepID=A0ABU9BXK7_9BURK